MKTQHNTGFTLLEVLIAMALFAMVGMASYSVFSAVTDSDVLARERSDKINEIQRAMLVMERDFVQLAHRKIRIEGDAPRIDYLMSDDSQFDEDVNNLAFVRLGWRNPGLIIPRSDVQAVAYYFDEEKKSLMRSHHNFVDAAAGEKAKERELLTGVVSVAFEFFDGEKWQKANEGGLPQAIAVTIELEQLGNIRRQFLLPSGVI
jgi:general secretion pathway protein J